MAPTMSKVEPYRLACPFALRNQEHYKDAPKSNCTTPVGFTDRQLLRQHIISQHLALCPRCFETKTTDGKSAPDKNLKSVLEWRRLHIPTCRPTRPQTLPVGKFPFRDHKDDNQVAAFERFDEQPILGPIHTKKQQDFTWWRSLFNALYPKVTTVPEPDTSYYVARPDIEKEVARRVKEEFGHQVKRAAEAQMLRMAEDLVHSTLVGQVGLPPEVEPDASKYQRLGSFRDLLSRSSKFDMVRFDEQSHEQFQKQFQQQLDSMLKTIARGPPISDSGYDSMPRSDPMDLDEGNMSIGTEQNAFSHVGGGTGNLRRGRDNFERELDSSMKRSRR